MAKGEIWTLGHAWLNQFNDHLNTAIYSIDLFPTLISLLNICRWYFFLLGLILSSWICKIWNCWAAASSNDVDTVLLHPHLHHLITPISLCFLFSHCFNSHTSSVRAVFICQQRNWLPGGQTEPTLQIPLSLCDWCLNCDRFEGARHTWILCMGLRIPCCSSDVV